MLSQIFLYSPRKLGKMNPFWRAYVSNGLVQPPTSILYCIMCFAISWIEELRHSFSEYLDTQWCLRYYIYIFIYRWINKMKILFPSFSSSYRNFNTNLHFFVVVPPEVNSRLDCVGMFLESNIHTRQPHVASGVWKPTDGCPRNLGSMVS